MRLPWVSRSAYELALQQLRAAQERNDRLTEAISRANGAASLIMPQPPVTVEVSAGWFDTKSSIKETKYVQS